MRPSHQNSHHGGPLRSRLVVAMSIAAIAAIAVGAVTSAQTAGGRAVVSPGRDAPLIPGYQLTWKDDFNGAAGKPVEPGKWIYDTGTGYGCDGCPPQWGTFEIESMTDSTANVSFDGQGNLLITPVWNPLDNSWTSGRIVPAPRARSISSAVRASSSSCSACAHVQLCSPALASAYCIPASLAAGTSIVRDSCPIAIADHHTARRIPIHAGTCYPSCQ